MQAERGALYARAQVMRQQRDAALEEMAKALEQLSTMQARALQAFKSARLHGMRARHACACWHPACLHGPHFQPRTSLPMPCCEPSIHYEPLK